jgi:YebC/PmpR family DNA-binding regulatory protein
MAVKAGGPNPESNSTLRRVIQNARSANMPRDKVEAAIKRAAGQDQKNFETVVYEGYGPHGVPIIVETATDNPTRTVASVRCLFRDHKGSLGNSGSVSFMFQQMGVFRLAPDGLNLDDLELTLIDHGLEEMGEGTGEKGERQIVIRCAFQNFGKLQTAIEKMGITPLTSESAYIAKTFSELPEAQAVEVLALVDALEQDDDVQNVFHNLA